MIHMRLPAILIWLWLACSQLALAQEAPSEAAYEAALDRALEAHGAGNFAEAEAAMREAHALSPNARTLRRLGVILYAEKRYLEAIAPLEAALASAEKALSAELRAGVEELLSRIWQRVGRLTLRVEPASREVRIDGAAPLLHGTDIVLAAGEHQVEVTAPEREPYVLTLRTQAGSRDSLYVVLAAASGGRPASTVQRVGPVAPAPEAVRLADLRRRDKRLLTPTWRTGLLVGGGALLVAGAASWLTAFVRYDALERDCERGDGCDPRTLPQRYEDKRILPLNAAGIALVSTGAAALLTVGALELWQWHRTKRRAGATDVRVGTLGTGLTLHAQF